MGMAGGNCAGEERGLNLGFRAEQHLLDCLVLRFEEIVQWRE